MEPNNGNEKDTENDERKEVSKHYSNIETECLDDDIIEEDSNESCENVHKTDIKDDGAAWKHS